MPIVDVVNIEGKKVGETELSESIFGGPVKEYLFHEAVRWQLACRRLGNAKAQERGEVTGSTRKLFRQKGTGRARRGSAKAAGLRGGGVVFGPRKRDYSYTLPKKVRKAAIRSALARRFEENSLVVVDSLSLAEVKTKKAFEIMGKLGVKNALVVDDVNGNLNLSVRNLKNYKYLPVSGLNVMDILRFDSLVMTSSAVEAVHGGLK